MAEIGDKLLTLPILQLEMSSLHQKLRFEKPEWNIKLKKLNWCRIVQIQGKGREGFARDLGKKRENLKFECFPANPSQILPTFCHGTKVKPLKI